MKVKIVLSMLVLALGLLAVTEAQGQQVITSVDRTNGATNASGQLGAYDGNTDPLPMEEGGVKDGNLIRSDRNAHRFVNTPTGTLGLLNKPLIGSEYVRTFNNDKDAGGVNVRYAVTISMQATVWISMDDRWGDADRQAQVDSVTSLFASAGTFKPTGLKVFVAGDSDRPMSIYAAELGPGTYVFGPQQGNNFYTIGAIAGDPTFNPAPFVDAKPDHTVAIYKEDTLQLNATVTDQGPQEGDPGVLSWLWSKGSGPGTATFSNTTILDPTVTFSAKGTYELVLTATDGDKDANDIVTVIVLDHADDKMIAHWPFDVTNGPRDVMDSLNKNHGDFVLADSNSVPPAYVPGWIGSGALSFPGTSHVLVSIDANSVPNFNNAPRTGASVSAWVKVDAFDENWQNVVSRGDNSWRIARSSRTGDSGNSMAFHVSGVTTTPANGPSGKIGVNDGYWHHVAGTYNGKAIRFYVDGVLDVTQPASGLLTQSTYDIWIGGNSQTNPSRRWKGLIDDVRVYNYGLSQAEVLALTGMGQVPPVVNAGPDQALQYRPGEKISLGGMAANNGPGPLTTTWAVQSAPEGGVAVFDDASSPATQVSFQGFGPYVLSLTAQNSYATLTDTVTINVSSPTCADVIAEGKLMAGDLSGPDGTPDCRIDLYDFVRMAEDWMRCNDPGAVECEYPY
ncbi:MAG: hypothetical protein IH624_16145 [Phycisphaerae bacterium]|nr:hypothetical protein [Phycisphaerae bacterium]